MLNCRIEAKEKQSTFIRKSKCTKAEENDSNIENDYFSVPESETDTSESGKKGVSDLYVDKPSTSLRELSCTNTSSQIKCNQYSQNRMSQICTS